MLKLISFKSNFDIFSHAVLLDPETILNEEYVKKPCKRYMTVGDCAFGFSCRFSHYTPSMIWELQRLGNYSNFQQKFESVIEIYPQNVIVTLKNSKNLGAMPKNGWPNADDIIKEYFEDIKDSKSIEELSYPTWNTPSELQSYPNLPPSLWPLTPESIVDCSNVSVWA